jgi:hypothetical protein
MRLIAGKYGIAGMKCAVRAVVESILIETILSTIIEIR